MRVVFVGRRRDAFQSKRLCADRDFAELTRIGKNALVVILETKVRHCFRLRTLARWFLDHAIAWNTLPRLPTTGEKVSRSVYLNVLREASAHEPEFVHYMHGETAQLPPDRFAFVTGDDAPEHDPEVTFSIDELLDAYEFAMDRQPSSSRSRSPRRSPPVRRGRSPRRSPSRPRSRSRSR